MKAVWKYEIDARVNPTLAIPGKVVHVASQSGITGIVTVWSEVVPERLALQSDVDLPRYTIYGTGHPIPNEAWHVGSTIDGPFVWHLYREPAQ